MRALHGLGEPARDAAPQRQVPPHLADLPVASRPTSPTSDALRAIVERHEITGIVHLAATRAAGTAGGIEATAGP